MTTISSTTHSASQPRTGSYSLSSPGTGSNLLTSIKLPKASSAAAKAETGKVQTPKAPLSNEDLSKLVQEMQTKMDKLNPDLAFSIDQASGRTVIELTDRATHEVIQQFPSEAVLRISKALDQFQKGQLLNRKA